MANNYYFIDGSVSAGQSTLLAIQNESAGFGIGATSDISAGIITATTLGIVGLTTTQNLIVTGITTTTDLRAQQLIVSGITTVGLGTTAVPPSNSQLSFFLLNNTTLRISARGTDGVLRFANITLA